MKNLMRPTRAFINGNWIKGTKHFQVRSPEDGRVLCAVPDCDLGHVREAIEAAHTAMQSWKRETAETRSGLLMKWHQEILEHKEQLAQLIVDEEGKPLAEALAEITYGADYISFYAEEGKRVYGSMIPSTVKNKRIMVTKQPVGVVSAITPWNFPNAMITRKVAPALAVGCAVVLKPAEATPLSALALAALAEKAGIPPGLFNVVTASSGAEVGLEMTTHPLVKKVSFTGSTNVGKLLMAQAATTLKRLSLELGGSAPFIVFEDADLDAAIEGLIASKFRNYGQTCVCTNRIYVHSSVHDVFVKKLVAAAQQVFAGPLINEAARDKVLQLVSNAVDKGATVALGGAVAPESTRFQPTVLTGIPADADICSAEIFGPVAAVYTFETEQEVLEAANSTPYGLASYFYTRDVSRVFRVSEALEYGMVGVNSGVLSSVVAPFGGVKESGMGREGSYLGLDDYLNIKYTGFEL